MMKKINLPLISLLDDAITNKSHSLSVGISEEEYLKLSRLIRRNPNKTELLIVSMLWHERNCKKSSLAYLSKLPCKHKNINVINHHKASIDIGDNDLILLTNNTDNFILKNKDIINTNNYPLSLSDHNTQLIAYLNLLKFPDINNYKSINQYKYNSIPHIIKLSPVYNNNSAEQEQILSHSFILGYSSGQDIFYGHEIKLKNHLLIAKANISNEKQDNHVYEKYYQACHEIIDHNLASNIITIDNNWLETCFNFAAKLSLGLAINLDNIVKDHSISSVNDILFSKDKYEKLIIATSENINIIKEIFVNYDILLKEIGHTTTDGYISVLYKRKEIIKLPSSSIIENAPRYRKKYIAKTFLSKNNINNLLSPDLTETIAYYKNLILKNKYIYKNYLSSDHHINLITIKIPDKSKWISCFLAHDDKLIAIDPYEGSRRLLYIALLNLALIASSPLAISCCLHLDHPDDINVITDMNLIIDGISDISISLNIPVLAMDIQHLDDKKLSKPMLSFMLIGLNKSPILPQIQKANDNDLLVCLGDPPTGYAGCEDFIQHHIPKNDLKTWNHQNIINLTKILPLIIDQNIISYAKILDNNLIHEIMILIHHIKRGISLTFTEEWLFPEVILALLAKNAHQVIININIKNINKLSNICSNNISMYILGQWGGDSLIIKHNQKILYQEHINNL